MKKVLIRLTGLLVTAAIAMSGNGLVLATEVEGTGNETGTAAEETAEEPKVEETSAPEEKETPAETPAETSAETPAEETKSEETAASDAAPADSEETKEAPSQEDKSSEEPAATESLTEEEKVTTVVEKVPGVKRSNVTNYGGGSKFNYLSFFNVASASEDVAFANVRSQIIEVANGRRTSTRFEVPVSSFNNSDEYENFSLNSLGLTANSFKDSNTITVNNDRIFDIIKDEIGFSFSQVILGLIYSCPYEMFWYQGSYTTDGTDFSSVYETTGARFSYKCTVNSAKTKASITAIIFELKVAEAYRGADMFTVDSSKVAKAIAAKGNADKIIAENKNKSDVEKLKAYRDAICSAVESDEAAFAINEILGGDPWQMTSVFDNSSSTDAACDGYARAFQYLCDNTTFSNSNIYALTVYGDTVHSNSHVWNLIRMEDGMYYIVDLWAYDYYQQRSHFLGGATNRNGKYYPANADGYYAYGGIKLAYADAGAGIETYVSASDYDIGDEPAPAPDPVPEFTGTHGMSLTDSICVRFVVSFPDDFDTTNCYVTFNNTTSLTTKNTVYYADSTVREGNERYFTCEINALELSDYLTATLHYGDNKTITSDPYSAMDYIYSMKTKHPDNAKLVNLLNGLHAYGYYMQKSGWTDNKTHANIPDPAKFLSTADITSTVNSLKSYSYVKNLGNSGLDDDVKLGLTLNSKTEFRVSVKPASGVSITSTGYTTKEIDGATYYQFTVGRIGPRALGTPRSFTITTTRGTATITVPAIYYVNIILTKDKYNTNQKLALVAYYNYYSAAMAYN